MVDFAPVFCTWCQIHAVIARLNTKFLILEQVGFNSWQGICCGHHSSGYQILGMARRHQARGQLVAVQSFECARFVEATFGQTRWSHGGRYDHTAKNQRKRTHATVWIPHLASNSQPSNAFSKSVLHPGKKAALISTATKLTRISSIFGRLVPVICCLSSELC